MATVGAGINRTGSGTPLTEIRARCDRNAADEKAQAIASVAIFCVVS
jgi:hypothetical protein